MIDVESAATQRVPVVCQVCGDPADVIWSGDKSVRCAKHLTDEVRQIIRERGGTIDPWNPLPDQEAVP